MTICRNFFLALFFGMSFITNYLKTRYQPRCMFTLKENTVLGVPRLSRIGLINVSIG